MNFLENFIMSIDWYDPQNGIRINHVIFKKENIVFILIDDAGKIKDVSYMPNYIQDDYVKYRSREIEELDINILATSSSKVDMNSPINSPSKTSSLLLSFLYSPTLPCLIM